MNIFSNMRKFFKMLHTYFLMEQNILFTLYTHFKFQIHLYESQEQFSCRRHFSKSYRHFKRCIINFLYYVKKYFPNFEKLNKNKKGKMKNKNSVMSLWPQRHQTRPLLCRTITGSCRHPGARGWLLPHYKRCIVAPSLPRPASAPYD